MRGSSSQVGLWQVISWLAVVFSDSVVGKPRETEEVITRNQCVLTSGRNIFFPRFRLYRGNCLERLTE